MYRAIFVFVFSLLFVGCKSTSSEIKDLLYKSDKGIYYFAWNDYPICIGVCTHKPESVEEALKVCDNGVRYINRESEVLEDKLRFRSIIDTDKDLAFLYEITEPSDDYKEVCFSEYILGKAKRGDIPWYLDTPGEYSPGNTEPEYASVYLKPISGKIGYDFIHEYRISDLLIFHNNVIVKPVKSKLNFDQAVKYCNEPNPNVSKYIKDWSKVRLGLANAEEALKDKTSYSFWTNVVNEKTNKVVLNGGYEVSKDNLDQYTVCTTDVSNLEGVYIYSNVDIEFEY